MADGRVADALIGRRVPHRLAVNRPFVDRLVVGWLIVNQPLVNRPFVDRLFAG
ncbi:hypothetical protein ACWEFL_15015 [Streptomyces sp. NPDC004838]